VKNVVEQCNTTLLQCTQHTGVAATLQTLTTLATVGDQIAMAAAN